MESLTEDDVIQFFSKAYDVEKVQKIKPQRGVVNFTVICSERG